MALVKAAKEVVDKSYTTFKFYKTALSKSLKSSVPVNERTLTTKLCKLEEALNELNMGHTSWVNKAELTDDQLMDAKYSMEWLEGLWGEFSDLQDQVENVLSLSSNDSSPPVQSNQHKLQIYSKQMETLKIDIDSKIQNLLSRISGDIAPDACKIYLEMLSSAKDSLNGQFIDLMNKILSFNQGNLNAELNDFESFRQKLLSKIVTIELDLAEKNSSILSVQSTTMRGIELQKGKAPEFTGKVLEYPEFKRGWKKVVGPRWDDGNQVEQIKLKVDPETKRIITRCKSMSEVWQALDSEYAQEQEVITAVNEELRQLRNLDCSTAEYLVKLRIYLPNLEDNLKEVDGLEHLHSPDRVNFIVEKFDSLTLHEWEYFRSKATGSTYSRFFQFIIDRYDSARSSIARLKAASSNTASINHVIQCSNCHVDGHFANECTHPQHQLVNRTSVASETECKRCEKWIARDGVYTCPGCGRGTPMGVKLNHCLEHCGAFMSMSVNDRSNCVENAKWCPVHLLGGHELAGCNMKNDPKYICGIQGCMKHHHKSLHSATTPFIANVNSTAFGGADDILLLVQSIPTKSGVINCFWDNGSTCCLITKSAAFRLKLHGEPMSISIETVSGTKILDSHSYFVTLIDTNGNEHIITAFCVDNISNHLKAVNVTKVKGEFSKDLQNKWHLLNRPSGEIELLVGLNAFGLHPRELEGSGNLKVLHSQFGSGYLLGGVHPLLKSQKIKWNDTVSCIRIASSHTINKLSVRPSYEFFEGEILGIESPKRCGNCLKCKDCSFRGSQLSQKEQYEFLTIESKITYSESQQCFYVQYPFTEDPNILPKNRSQVVKIAERQEKKLIKEGNLTHFNQEFDKMLSLGVIVEITESEMKAWKGAFHYVSMLHILRDASSSTPLRIATNSSLSDKRGLSLNNILMKGPNTLSDQWELLNRWRLYKNALCSDVSKAYWSLRTGEVEKHVRRVVWRHGDTFKAWKTYGFCVVSFGDRPAAAILEVAIKKIAELNKSIDPEAAHKITEDRYVDDIISGGSIEQIQRFVGNGNIPGTISKILSSGSLYLKAIITSGENSSEKLKILGSTVLGVGWEPSLDIISIDFTMNLKYSINLLLEGALSLRQCLSVLNSIYDPLGLVSPFTVRLRVAFRDLFRPGLNLKWDDKIPDLDQAIWKNLIQMLANKKQINFPRATTPTNAIGKCQLICFFDGSDQAYASVLYIRWNLMDGSIFTTLVNSKLRPTPLQRISTPRSELSGAVIASRLVLSTLRSWSSSEVLPERVWFIGDSECTLASIEKVSAAFGEFFGNRVGEIQSNQAKIEEFCLVGRDGEWWFTPSKENAADIATRLDSSCMDIDLGSVWQTGPLYLKTAESNWPINRQFASRKDDCVPQIELLKRYRCLIHKTDKVPHCGIDNILNPFTTNHWGVLLKRTQILLKAANLFQSPIKAAIEEFHEEPTESQRLFEAKRLWFCTAMDKTEEAMLNGKLKELDIQERHGLKVVIGRAQSGLQHFFGREYLPVLMADTRVAELIMTSAHWEDHAGRDITQAMARHEAWIVNSKRLAKKIVYFCVRCRYIRKSLVLQKMAVLPDYVQVQCPPFSNIGLDLCGPYLVKAMTNKRATMKVWVVIILCLNTKAVCLELAPGYSTADFMLAYMCHVNQRGAPSIVHSDRGSQLIAAQKEISVDPLRYDWEVIAASTAQHGTTWNFTPAGGQWRNGAAESFVKKFKRSFFHLYRETRLNYAEFLCAIKRISNILNHRPVSVQRTKTDEQEDDFLSPLTPNMLITGRSPSGPPKDYIDEVDPHVRYSYLEELENAWWYQYKVQYFQSLIPTRKWQDANRNIRSGDIVLIEYKSKSVPGTYRLGKVLKVEVDNDNLVRTCTVQYKLVKPITKVNSNTTQDVVTKEVRVPVQRLVLILPVEEQ